MHREVEGEIKESSSSTCASGKWYAYLLVDNGGSADELTVIDRAVGIDVGLEHYAVDSDGNEVENPRHLKQDAEEATQRATPLQQEGEG